MRPLTSTEVLSLEKRLKQLREALLLPHEEFMKPFYLTEIKELEYALKKNSKITKLYGMGLRIIPGGKAA